MQKQSFAAGPMMKDEFHLEINSAFNEPHVEIRSNTLAQAEEYAKRLFPKSYIKPFGDKGDTWYMYFSATEENANNAVGIIKCMKVPDTWVSNRRAAELQEQAA